MSSPIVEQITLDIVQTLQGVTLEAGFDNTLTVQRPSRLGNPPSDRLVVVHQLDPEQNEEAPQGHLGWFQPYLAVCFVMESESSATPIDQRINSIRSDVELALRADPNRCGLAVDTIINAPQLFSDDNGAFEGVAVSFEVHYRTLENDPYAQ